MQNSTRLSRTLSGRLERWFRASHRELPWRNGYSPYHVWISEIMLQQTRMEVVLDYYPRFIARFPTIEKLAAAEQSEVLAAWSGLGYYRRAKMLHEAARMIVEKHAGNLPDDADLLRGLPGIGRYTAGAIASIAFDHPVPVVEGNVTRLLSRIHGIAAPVGSGESNRRLWAAATDLVEVARSPRDLNQAMMELGALICTPRNTLCDRCAVADHCTARETGRIDALPVPRPRGAQHRLRIPLYLVEDSGRVLLRREQGRLMEGMFHLPHGSSELLPGSDESMFSAHELIGSFRHTVTNRNIEFQLFRASIQGEALRDGRDDLVWIPPDAIDSVPHPSYVRKALALMASTRSQEGGSMPLRRGEST